MDVYTNRQRVLLEVTLIVVGLLACFEYWWHGGALRTPSYILFGMSAVAGYIGLWLRFKRSGDTMSHWSIWNIAVEIVAPVVGGLLALLAVGQTVAVYPVLGAYGLVVMATWVERRAVAARRRQQQRRQAL